MISMNTFGLLLCIFSDVLISMEFGTLMCYFIILLSFIIYVGHLLAWNWAGPWGRIPRFCLSLKSRKGYALLVISDQYLFRFCKPFLFSFSCLIQPTVILNLKCLWSKMNHDIWRDFDMHYSCIVVKYDTCSVPHLVGEGIAYCSLVIWMVEFSYWV